MSVFIGVPTAWAVYEVEGEAVLATHKGLPPHVMMELLVMSGHAKRVGDVSAASTISPEEGEEDEGESEHGLWFDNEG